MSFGNLKSFCSLDFPLFLFTDYTPVSGWTSPFSFSLSLQVLSAAFLLPCMIFVRSDFSMAPETSLVGMHTYPCPVKGHGTRREEERRERASWRTQERKQRNMRARRATHHLESSSWIQASVVEKTPFLTRETSSL